MVFAVLALQSPSSKWLEYQFLAGIGLGISFEVPIMVRKALAKPEDVAIVTAILIYKSEKALNSNFNHVKLTLTTVAARQLVVHFYFLRPMQRLSISSSQKL